MNRVIIIGNLGQKPDARQTKSGLTVCNLNVATNERVKKGDSWEDHTEWHRVVVFGKQAENCARFLDKGSKVAVEGRNRTSSYEDKQGNTRYTTEVISDRVEFLSKAENGVSRDSEDRPQPGPSQPQASPSSAGSTRDEDIPF